MNVSGFLNTVREAETPISVKKRILRTVALACVGAALGAGAKLLDMVPANALPSVLAWLDIANFLGRFAFWALIALCISVYGNSPVRAGLNVFVFLAGMVAAYYGISYSVAGFFPKGYAMVWVVFTVLSPFPAFVCWYAKGRSRAAFALSVCLLAVLFNMTFVYGWGYFGARSVLEAVVFAAGVFVLKRSSLRGTVWMIACGIVLAGLLNIVVPFRFG